MENNTNHSSQEPNFEGQHQQKPVVNPYREPEPMGMMEAVKACFDKFADFEGRSRRSEFWYFRLFQIVLIVVGGFIAALASLIHEYLAIAVLVILVLAILILIIPSLAVTVRRFHDVGQSGMWLLLDIFCTNGIISIVFGCMDSQPGHNKYGPNPKGMQNDW